MFPCSKLGFYCFLFELTVLTPQEDPSLSCPIQSRKMVIYDAQIDFWHEGGPKTLSLTFLKKQQPTTP